MLLGLKSLKKRLKYENISLEIISEELEEVSAVVTFNKSQNEERIESKTNSGLVLLEAKEVRTSFRSDLNSLELSQFSEDRLIIKRAMSSVIAQPEEDI
jgi:hypothetical protein